MSNYEWIKTLNQEELAKLLTIITDDAQLDSDTKVNYSWDKWLKEERQNF